jgi:hypothetical protein
LLTGLGACAVRKPDLYNERAATKDRPVARHEQAEAGVMKIALKSDRVADPVFVPMRKIANKIGHSSRCETKTGSSSRAQLRTFSSPQASPAGSTLEALRTQGAPF